MSRDETKILQNQVMAGKADQAVGELMARYQDRLEKIVAFRMDRRLARRVDSSDIVQETFVEAVGRLDAYRECSDKMSFFLWLRFLALQKLNQMYRHHFGAAARDVRRDISMNQKASTQATSMVLAAQLLGNVTSPSGAAVRQERRQWLEKSLSEIDETDREILALRHFEQLGNHETAGLLEISETAASNRYVRALKRLKIVMQRLNSFSSESPE